MVDISDPVAVVKSSENGNSGSDIGIGNSELVYVSKQSLINVWQTITFKRIQR